jgi:hypothetical protein
MRPVVPVLAVACLTAACLAACGGGGLADNSIMNPDSAINPPTATPVAKTNFTTFTEKLIGSQSETEEPLAVAPTDFYFPDDDNEAAFAAVAPAA